MFATFGSLNIYVAGVPIGLFICLITFISCVQRQNKLEGQLSKLFLESSKPKFLKRMARKKSIQGLTPGEVQDSNICNTLGHDYNLTRGCHRFYYLVPFTVFDSSSHPFLPCQCSFTFCVVWRINLRTVNGTSSKKTRLSLHNFKGVQNNKVYKLVIYSTIIKSFTFYCV